MKPLTEITVITPEGFDASLGLIWQSPSDRKNHRVVEQFLLSDAPLEHKRLVLDYCYHVQVFNPYDLNHQPKHVSLSLTKAWVSLLRQEKGKS